MKKKHLLLMGILVSTSVFASGFRNSEWGDSYSKISKVEKNQKMVKSNVEENQSEYYWNKTIYSFTDDLKSAGKFDVKYTLLKDKLIKGTYSQEIKDGNLNNYNKMKKILVNKYGEIQNQFSSSYYENDGKKEIKTNKTLSVWLKDNTRIELLLVNKDEFEINYYTTDNKIQEFIKNTGLEKKRAKEKELLKDSDYIEKLI